jgi:16S rRNA (adenine1518-N6/adenine1519-N6)-dimethyltransferase
VIQAYKKFGQNFLQDQRCLQQIAEAVAVKPGEKLLEVGPGLGGLTLKLLDRGFTLTAVEIDIRLVRELQRLFAGQEERVQIEHGDILRTDLWARAGGPGGLVLVGNIPYNITNMLILHILKSRQAVARAYLTVQKEVGERLSASPDTKAYSFLSAVVQTFYRPRPLFIIPPEAFRPIPQVDSAVMEFTSRAEFAPLIDNNNKYIRMVSNAFSQRRKKVINVLSRFYPREAVQAFFTEHQLSENLRAENLPVETFVKLVHHLRESV